MNDHTYCHGCGALVPKSRITFQDIIYQYCVECDLSMKIKELEALVTRIDALKHFKEIQSHD